MKPLRLLVTLSAAMTLAIAITACGGSSKTETPSLKVSPSSLTFDDAEGSKTVSVTSNVDWTAKSSDSWITVTPVSGQSSSAAQTLTVKISANPGLDRNATVTITAVDGAPSSQVTVTQTAYMPTKVEEPTVKEALGLTDPYKYQKFRLKGTVRYLSSDGSFNLMDETGSIPVAGLNASDAGYGKKGGALGNVKERDKVTVVGYLEKVDGKMSLVYAYLEKVEAYAEPNPSTAATKPFPYSADYTTSDGGAIINNPVFPSALEAIWKRSSSTGWQASGYAGGTNYTTEAWLYTEKIDLKGAVKPILVFDHVVRNFDDIEMAKKQTSVWISADGGEFKRIAIPFSYPDEQGSSTMTSENISLSDFIGSTIQIGFKYVSNQANEAGTWCVLKVQVIKDEEPEQPDDSGGAEDYDKPDWDWNK